MRHFTEAEECLPSRIKELKRSLIITSVYRDRWAISSATPEFLRRLVSDALGVARNLMASAHSTRSSMTHALISVLRTAIQEWMRNHRSFSLKKIEAIDVSFFAFRRDGVLLPDKANGSMSCIVRSSDTKEIYHRDRGCQLAELGRLCRTSGYASSSIPATLVLPIRTVV